MTVMRDRAAGSPFQILLIDDNPGDVELTAQALQDSNIPSQVSVAENGFEALAFLRREGAYQDAPRPDLILLDLNLPGKDGRETLAEIAHDPVLSHIPVVILTVSDTERHLLETYHLAPNCYFVKPVDFDGFLAVVNSLNALSHRSLSAPLILEPSSSEEVIRVLLAEDNPGDVELTRAYLRETEQLSFTLEHVDGFTETLQRLEEAAFDVLLLDLSVLDGRDLRESLEIFKRASNIPVVVLTGLNDERFGIQAVKAGAEDYLVKGRAQGDLLVRSIRFATERHHRRHLQERLHQIQRLEEIGRLAGGVAHDFNNILTAIMGFTDLAREAAPQGEELPSYLAAISKSAERAADLTRQLLMFARKQAIQPQVLELNVCVQDAEQMLRRLIPRDIELLTQLAENLWRIKADPGQIEQVIVNLVVNARDAMPNGGRIEIETANVRLGDREPPFHRAQAGEYVQLSIRDTGEGMSEEVKAHIFEPFFTTKEQGKGTGLGLATCFGIVQQHGGIIAVDSRPGEGTAFRIYFPRVQEEVVATVEPTETATQPMGGETILLVDDEPMIRQFAAQALLKLGYRVLEASNGVEALNLLKTYRGPLDLLITDRAMPQMDGRELSERLRAVSPQIKVLFISGYNDDDAAEERTEEEGFGFLQKPFTPITLAHKIQEMLIPNGNQSE